MPPKKKPTLRDPARSGTQKPSDKGKQRAADPGTPQQASSSKQGCRSRADQEFEAQEAWALDDSDPIHQDLAGAEPTSLAMASEVDRIMTIHRLELLVSETADMLPGEEDTDARAPPSIHVPSPPRLLQPPSHVESMSSASSRGSKRRRETTLPQQRQASRTQYDASTRGQGHAPSPR